MKVHTLICPSCGANIDIEENRDNFFCTYCGAKLYLDNGTVKIDIIENIDIKDEERIKELELDDKKDKKKFLGEHFQVVISLGAVVAFIILCFITTLFAPDGIASKNITIPNNYRYYKGENYKDVVQELEDAGFENIKTKKIEDLVTGWVTKDGEVEKISINGKTKFGSGEVFSRDSKIVISYHTFEKKKN